MQRIKRCEDYFVRKMCDHVYCFDEFGRVFKEFDEKKCRHVYKRVDIPCSNGYRKVQHQRDFISHSCLVHRLMYAWLFGIPDDLEINHKDGNRSNNRISNLEAVTSRENILHAIHVLGTRDFRGERNANRKFTATDIRRMRELRRQGCSYQQISDEFGVSKKHLSKIILRRVWTEVE